MSELPGAKPTGTTLGGGGGVSTPKSRLHRGLAVPRVVVSTGMKEDVFNFQWKIENFDLIRAHDYLVKSQEMTITTDEGLRWSFSLSLGTNAQSKAFIGVMRRLIEIPSGVWGDDKVFSSMDLEVMSKSFIQPKKVQMKERGRMLGWNTVIPRDSDVENLELVDGALIINITLKSFIKLRTSTSKRKSEEEFECKSSKKIGKDLGALLEKSEEGSTVPDISSTVTTFSDVRIFCKDGTEFRAHKAILAARSPVFQAMFQSNYFEEAQTGFVKIEDVPGKVFKILLDYIYSGALSKNWKEEDIIEDFSYAVDKYQLVDLREYLDDTLGGICTDETVVKYLELAERFSLKNAEVQLIEYMKNHGWSRASCFSDIVKLFNIE